MFWCEMAGRCSARMAINSEAGLIREDWSQIVVNHFNLFRVVRLDHNLVLHPLEPDHLVLLLPLLHLGLTPQL